jgi:phage terminase large subunit-like protein
MTEKLTREQLLAIEKSVKAAATLKRYDKLAFYKPYPKQLQFHSLGATKMERMFSAANRSGKTEAGAAELAMHLTGEYPEWWEGRRFTKEVVAWAAAPTALMARDGVQEKLLGKGYDYGTGMVPKRCVDWKTDIAMGHGASSGIDRVFIKHKNGRKSELYFKTFAQGWEAWQSIAVDIVWMDEEADDFKLYQEAVTRLTPTSLAQKPGLIYTTFTPLSGETPLVLRFKEEDDGSKNRGFVEMDLKEAEHISPETYQQMYDACAPHLRDAKIHGKPALGEGAIFPYPEKSISCEPFEVPAYWHRLWGLDFGTGHPFGAVLLAWDKEADVIYVTHCIKMVGSLPLDHVQAMKPFGLQIPCAWPQDGHARRDDGAGDLKSLRDIYRKHGARMMDEHAKFLDGSRGTETGITEMAERFRTGRLKVFTTCRDWFSEYHSYHRKDGLIVKVRDDLMSATRVGIMDRRHAKVVFSDQFGNDSRRKSRVAKGGGSDWNPWD